MERKPDAGEGQESELSRRLAHNHSSAHHSRDQRIGPTAMIEAVKFWNEPNNKSHWDFELDPEWRTYSEMVKVASSAVIPENPSLTRVLGGISPIDRHFI